MELLALGKPIKKPPCSDERDGELFCGTLPTLVAVQTKLNNTTPVVSGNYYLVCVMADTRIALNISGANVISTSSDVPIQSYNVIMRGYLVQATSDTLSCSSSTPYGYIIYEI